MARHESAREGHRGHCRAPRGGPDRGRRRHGGVSAQLAHRRRRHPGRRARADGCREPAARADDRERQTRGRAARQPAHDRLLRRRVRARERRPRRHRGRTRWAGARVPRVLSARPRDTEGTGHRHPLLRRRRRRVPRDRDRGGARQHRALLLADGRGASGHGEPDDRLLHRHLQHPRDPDPRGRRGRHPLPRHPHLPQPGPGRIHRRRDRRRRLQPAHDRHRADHDRGRAPEDGDQRDARPRRRRHHPARCDRATDAAVHRRCQPRAAHPARHRARLCRALPHGRRARRRGRRAVDGAHREGGHPHGPSRRGPARPRPSRRTPRRRHRPGRSAPRRTGCGARRARGRSGAPGHGHRHHHRRRGRAGGSGVGRLSRRQAACRQPVGDLARRSDAVPAATASQTGACGRRGRLCHADPASGGRRRSPGRRRCSP